MYHYFDVIVYVFRSYMPHYFHEIVYVFVHVGLITCITFEHGHDMVQGTNGVHVNNNGVNVVETGCLRKKCGQFVEGATLDIPYFYNNIAFKPFSVSFFYRSHARMNGFMWNGCPSESGSSLSIGDIDWDMLTFRLNDAQFHLWTSPHLVRIHRL